MFKKIWSFFCIISLLSLFCHISSAGATEFVGNDYPKYLNEEQNYICCDWRSGSAWYVDKNSIEVELDADDAKIVTAEIVWLQYDESHGKPYNASHTKKMEISTKRFLYDLPNEALYIDADDDKEKEHYTYIEKYETEWRHIERNGPWSDVGVIKPAALMIYQLLYGEDFY